MAGAAAANWPTFGDFTFDLSERLRDAARTSLAELEASINRDGYDWLEDYIDNIQAQDRRWVENWLATRRRPVRTSMFGRGR